MKKYNTRPIDFTGCHPVIAEALKRGEEIECRAWDNKGAAKKEIWVCRYKSSAGLPYRSETDTPWKYAEPIPLKPRRIMPPERAIRVLIAGGWVFSTDGRLVGPEQTIIQSMFHCMGKLVDDPSVSHWSWPPCIIEEVEDDE